MVVAEDPTHGGGEKEYFLTGTLGKGPLFADPDDVAQTPSERFSSSQKGSADNPFKQAVEWQKAAGATEEEATSRRRVTVQGETTLTGAGGEVAEDAINEARNLGPDYLDELTGGVLVVAVLLAAAYLLRPFAQVLANLTG